MIECIRQNFQPHQLGPWMSATSNDWSTIRGKRGQPGDGDVLSAGAATDKILGVSGAVPIDPKPARPLQR